MRIKIRKNTLFLIFWIVLLIIQSPLEQLNSAFSYLDEITALLGIVMIVLHFQEFSTLDTVYHEKQVIFLLTLYIFIGLLANIIYNYQPINIVIQDLFVNVKFYLSVLFGLLLFNKKIVHKDRAQISSAMRLLSLAFLALFVVDRVTSCFGISEVRFGIRSFKLNYYHQTYLAAAFAGLITLLIIFYEKANRKFIIIDTIMMAFTLRSKAFGAAIVLIVLAYIIFIHKGKFKVWQMLLLAFLGLLVGWSQISFYFIKLGGQSARSVMLLTSLKIMREYFPIGTGFSTFASHMAGAHYSPIYIKYGLQTVYGLSDSTAPFLDDQFWPIIFGQTGFLGTIVYIGILFIYYRRISLLRHLDKYIYCGTLFSYIYLLISSTSEPAFNNSIACLFGIIFGIVFKQYAVVENQEKYGISE